VDPKIWDIIIGCCSVLIVGSIAWGRQQGTIKSHTSDLEKCKDADYMTREKCETFHATVQETNNVILKQMQSSLDKIESKIECEAEKSQKYQLQLAAMLGREGFKNVQ